MKNANIALIKISDISIDGGTQQRERINPEIVAEYTDAMRCGAQFPAVIVFHDGVHNWLADGFHRFHACREMTSPEILAEVHVGTQRDAVLYSTGANNAHGQRLSNADKRHAVGVMLTDKEWSQWSNKAIAKHCKVTDVFVGKVREEKYPTKLKGQTVCPPIADTAAAVAPAVENIQPAAIKEITPQKPVAETEYAPGDHEADELAETIRILSEENDALKDRLSIELMPASEEEKTVALDTICGLRQEVKRLEIENRALIASRDSYQRDNGEMKMQMAAQRRQIAKLQQVSA